MYVIEVISVFLRVVEVESVKIIFLDFLLLYFLI